MCITTFEWDGSKALANIRKHGVDFEEAASAFADPLSRTISDPDNSAAEERCILLGLSSKARLLVVVHLDRGDTIRIISVRTATTHERQQHEEG